ncbi:protein TRACHEARY ELEMENT DIFFERENTIATION-RELATED 7A [Triticum aestivum]|uniref:protein TRACHEARY ELEMENT DIFFERENTIATION-RELATED 7A n=1 Tax=Triticum aestivum TaxID=4565 RepID=UPI001D02ECE8|nr:protein TRACHEARY ELEMENT DIFFERENTIATION-RELATED 7A-like [Triticum aestivum]
MATLVLNGLETPRAPTHGLQSTLSPNRSRPHPPPTLATPPPPPTAPSTTPPPPPPPLSAPTTARHCCRLRPPHPTAADCRRRRPHITAPPRTRTTPPAPASHVAEPLHRRPPSSTTSLVHTERAFSPVSSGAASSTSSPPAAGRPPSSERLCLLNILSLGSCVLYFLSPESSNPLHSMPPIRPLHQAVLCRLRLDSTSSPSPPPSSVASPLLPRLSSDTYGIGFTASCTSQPTSDLLSKEGMCYCIMFIGSMVAQWQKLLCMQLEAGFPRVHKLMSSGRSASCWRFGRPTVNLVK